MEDKLFKLKMLSHLCVAEHVLRSVCEIVPDPAIVGKKRAHKWASPFSISWQRAGEFVFGRSAHPGSGHKAQWIINTGARVLENECVCVCVCARVRVRCALCVRACVRVRVCVCPYLCKHPRIVYGKPLPQLVLYARTHAHARRHAHEYTIT